MFPGAVRRPSCFWICRVAGFRFCLGVLKLKICFKCKVNICYSVRNSLVICRVSWGRELPCESISILFLYVEASRKGRFKVLEFKHLPETLEGFLSNVHGRKLPPLHLQSLLLSWACVCCCCITALQWAVAGVPQLEFPPCKKLCWTTPVQPACASSTCQNVLEIGCVCNMKNLPRCCFTFQTLSVWWQDYPGWARCLFSLNTGPSLVFVCGILLLGNLTFLRKLIWSKKPWIIKCWIKVLLEKRCLCAYHIHCTQM